MSLCQFAKLHILSGVIFIQSPIIFCRLRTINKLLIVLKVIGNNVENIVNNMWGGVQSFIFLHVHTTTSDTLQKVFVFSAIDETCTVLFWC